jgi:hypothetical protein
MHCIILLNIKMWQVNVISFQGDAAPAIEKLVRAYCVMTVNGGVIRYVATPSPVV